MQALAGCLGWRLEGAGSMSRHQQLILRYGTLFRLRLPMSEQAQDSSCTQGSVELAPTGTVLQKPGNNSIELHFFTHAYCVNLVCI